MEVDSTLLSRLVDAPSVGAIYCQACALEAELSQISQEGFSEEACHIKNVFLCVLQRGKHELLRILNANEPYSDEHDPSFLTTRELAKSLHMVYLYVRFLRASSRDHCPVGIQTAISALVKLHFPSSNIGVPVCLVRAQPRYMAAYVEPITELFKEVHPSLFDPTAELYGKYDNWIVIYSLWSRWREGLPEAEKKMIAVAPPAHISIISFAGLDDHDALLYPILAHEIGHFISFSRKPYVYLTKEILDRVERELKRVQFTNIEEKQLISQRVGICLRELMADLLAVRIMGLSFFLAHAEFLKTLAHWNKECLLSSREGYPEIHFRLALVLGSLLEEESPMSLSPFLRKHQSSHRYEVNVVITLLDQWQKRLADMNNVKHVNALFLPHQSSNSKSTEKIIADAILGCLSDLKRIAAEIVPLENVPTLGMSFFARIDLLKERKAPHLQSDTPDSFFEILAAAWTYQLGYSEAKEWSLKSDPKQMIKEYDDTCRLVLDALNGLAKTKDILKIEKPTA